MELLKVTGVARTVTDPVLLGVLVGQGIDKDGVELSFDYAPRSKGKGFSPYGKLYRDLNSETRFMVVSGLPMVDAYGQRHELEWRDKNGVIASGSNIFYAGIEHGGIRLVTLSDQPGGIKKDGEAVFHPQLFIGEGEIKPLSDFSRLLETDPSNDNYHNNVLEWDYGICKRRIRLIEGRFLGSWVFLHHPRADVIIRYNRSGVINLRLSHARTDDEEFVPQSYFEGKTYPVVIADSAAFYPDAHPETATVDGEAYDNLNELTWANLKNQPGKGAVDNASTSYCALFVSHASTADRWAVLQRGIQGFYIDLPAGSNITAATYSHFGQNKVDQNSLGDLSINIYSAMPASNVQIAAGDFDSLGSAAWSSAKSYSNYSLSGYNDFPLNSSGLAAISIGQVLNIGIREATYDAGPATPAWAANKYEGFICYTAEQGSGYKPKLVITYTTGETKTSGDSGSGVEVITLRSLESGEQGTAAETGLVATSVISGDAGLGNENENISGQDSYYVSGSDGASGNDSVKALIQRSGAELRLHNYRGQVGIPNKEVNI